MRDIAATGAECGEGMDGVPSGAECAKINRRTRLKFL
jgi:hypothetical protein